MDDGHLGVVASPEVVGLESDARKLNPCKQVPECFVVTTLLQSVIVDEAVSRCWLGNGKIS
jgi:hypothetical protein